MQLRPKVALKYLLVKHDTRHKPCFGRNLDCSIPPRPFLKCLQARVDGDSLCILVTSFPRCCHESQLSSCMSCRLCCYWCLNPGLFEPANRRNFACPSQWKRVSETWVLSSNCTYNQTRPHPRNQPLGSELGSVSSVDCICMEWWFLVLFWSFAFVARRFYWSPSSALGVLVQIQISCTQRLQDSELVFLQSSEQWMQR